MIFFTNGEFRLIFQGLKEILKNWSIIQGKNNFYKACTILVSVRKEIEKY